jgi:hypothetical protein
MNGEQKEPTADELFAALVQKIATVDGIATSDAIEIGSMIRQYGDARAGESGMKIMGPLLDAMLKPKVDKKPWEETP